MASISQLYDRLQNTSPAKFTKPEQYDSWYIAECASDPTSEDMFLPEGVTILTGGQGTGKTAFATALGLSIAAREPFAGKTYPYRSQVAWFSAEETAGERAALLKHRRANDEEASEILPFKTFYGPLPLDNEENLCIFLRCFEECGNWVAVLDPLPSFVANPAAFRDLILVLKKLGLDYGISFLVILWSGNNGVIGGPGVRSAATAVWELCYRQLDDERLVDLKMSGRGYEKPKTLTFRSTDPLHYELTESDTSKKPPTLEEIVCAQLGDDPKTPKAIAAATGQNPDCVRNILASLVKRGTAHIAGKRGRSFTYVS